MRHDMREGPEQLQARARRGEPLRVLERPRGRNTCRPRIGSHGLGESLHGSGRPRESRQKKVEEGICWLDDMQGKARTMTASPPTTPALA